LTFKSAPERSEGLARFVHEGAKRLHKP